MMTILEEAIIYATVLHQGKIRKFRHSPFILHPLEVAQILSTMTEDQEIITAGILHDIIEDTDGTLAEIEKRFGGRVADLVDSASETKIPEKDKKQTWKRRKEESIKVLKNSEDIGVKMLWLADKLANIRSLAAIYSEQGDSMWEQLHEADPDEQHWYYMSIAENLELFLNKTGAFKELIKHINFIWPGSFDSEKTKYRKYREVSVDGCKVIGRGAKGEVYRYDEELIIKVFNQNNTYKDVEREIALSRKAFILGIPTAISFGIVSVGERYGAMYELLDSQTVSDCIARAPGRVDYYAQVMAELARTIHSITVTEEDGFPYAAGRITDYVTGGVMREDGQLGEACAKLLETIPDAATLIHGDFHSQNVFLHNGEPLLIDMDRLSVGHPIMEISDLYYFYVINGEEKPEIVEKFMGFSYDLARQFFSTFLKAYLQTEDEAILRDVTDKASVIGYSRLIRKIRKKRERTEADAELIRRCLEKLASLTDHLDTLAF